MSAGNIPPFFLSYGPASATNPGTVTTGAQTFAGAKTFTDTLTINKTAQAGVAEVLLQAQLTDDLVANFQLGNGSGTNSQFIPRLMGIGSAALVALQAEARGTTDSGSSGLMVFNVKTAAGAAITVRPYLDVQNNNTSMLQLIPLNSGADSALIRKTAGSANPAFTTRSAGTAFVVRDVIDASHADMAYGSTTSISWASIPQATNSYAWAVFAGTASVLQVDGAGRLTTNGGKVRKLRIALTTPVTVATTDDIVEVNLTTPGAVAINLFATPATGTEIVLQGGKGDEVVNAHTFTPAAGNINGAANYVPAALYYRRTAYYNGTQWLIG